MNTTDIIAIVAAAVSFLSLLVSWIAYKKSHQRGHCESAMELFELWEGVHLVGRTEPVTPHVVKAHKALKETARRWLNNVDEHRMIFGNFGHDYVSEYEAFRLCNAEAPGLGRTVSSLLTPELDLVYGQMRIYKE